MKVKLISYTKCLESNKSIWNHEQMTVWKMIGTGCIVVPVYLLSMITIAK
jgi:hypothetical protein